MSIKIIICQGKRFPISLMYQIRKTEASIVPSFTLRWDGAVWDGMVPFSIREWLIPWLSQLGTAPAPCPVLLILLALALPPPPAMTHPAQTLGGGLCCTTSWSPPPGVCSCLVVCGEDTGESRWLPFHRQPFESNILHAAEECDCKIKCIQIVHLFKSINQSKNSVLPVNPV